MSRYERTTYIVIIFLLLIISIKSCLTFSNLTNENISLNNLYNQIKVKHNEDSSKIYSMQVEYSSDIEEADRKIMALNLMQLKKPKEIVRIEYKTKVVTEIQLSEPISVDSSLYMKLPQNFSQNNKWFSLNGQITTKGSIKIDSLNSFGTFTYAVGDTLRRGLFNRLLRNKDHVVRLHIDNPYMEVSNLQNIYVRNEKKWYQTTGFKLIFGAAISFGIATAVK
jgi:hypothetical protein